ncbi:unnamed protein product [Caenorhabditis bovis]|uniref:Small ribosomal subunit protein mS26 n=1 Tax=Caenorhabditis bovis TaxID=2654633 RepID=A0A8S1EKP6_9PELO|nr:unnamed protein product [Caenorhabditis bovis]
MISSANLRILSRSAQCALGAVNSEGMIVQQKRRLGRRMPKQGKPPILPPSKKVLYHVVHAPWQKPEDVEQSLWQRHVYNNAVISLREIFRQELQQNASIGRGIDSMKEAEAKELDELISANERKNKAKAAERAARESENEKEAKNVILAEIEESLAKRNAEKKAAEQEVLAAIERSKEFVTRENLESKILEALEKPVVYDFAIDIKGNKYFNPEPVKYQEGTPTRQKGRLYDRTLSINQSNIVEEAAPHVDEIPTDETSKRDV